jgi:hypothetical protein
VNEATKQAYIDKTAAQLKEWSAKVDVIVARMSVESANNRIEWNKKLESWQQKETVLKTKLESMRSAGIESFEIMKVEAQSVWTGLSHFITSLEEKNNETK